MRTPRLGLAAGFGGGKAGTGELGTQFERALVRTWQSQGDPGALEDVARELGEAVGFFVRLLLQALAGLLDRATGQGGRGTDLVWGPLRDSRLFQRCRRLPQQVGLPETKLSWSRRTAINEGMNHAASRTPDRQPCLHD